MAFSDQSYNLWIIPTLFLGATFVSVTIFLTLLDVFNPTWWNNRKLQMTQQQKNNILNNIKQILPVVLRNIFFVSGPSICFAWWVRSLVQPDDTPLLFKYCPFLQEYTPTIFTTFIQLWMIHQISQITFWIAHKSVHSHPTLFKWVHALHHRHHQPFALTAIHCSVFEMWLLNIPAVIMGPLIITPDVLTHSIWMILAGIHTPLAHCGHDVLGNLASVKYHDDHHAYLRVNFGCQWIDQWLGTYYE